MYYDLRVPILTDGAVVALRRLSWRCLKTCEEGPSMKIDALKCNFVLVYVFVCVAVLLTPTPAHFRLFDAIVRDKVH